MYAAGEGRSALSILFIAYAIVSLLSLSITTIEPPHPLPQPTLPSGSLSSTIPDPGPVR
ncbi:hypothetical protein BDW42DRAFT_171284, partial [Aspergillus taichungensis]